MSVQQAVMLHFWLIQQCVNPETLFWTMTATIIPSERLRAALMPILFVELYTVGPRAGLWMLSFLLLALPTGLEIYLGVEYVELALGIDRIDVYGATADSALVVGLERTLFEPERGWIRFERARIRTGKARTRLPRTRVERIFSEEPPCCLC